MSDPKNDENIIRERLVRVESSLEHLATKADTINQIHEELKPFHEQRGEFKVVKQVLYVGLGVACPLKPGQV